MTKEDGKGETPIPLSELPSQASILILQRDAAEQDVRVLQTLLNRVLFVAADTNKACEDRIADIGTMLDVSPALTAVVGCAPTKLSAILRSSAAPDDCDDKTLELDWCGPNGLFVRAANEIDWLRAALTAIVTRPLAFPGHVARKALAGQRWDK